MRDSIQMFIQNISAISPIWHRFIQLSFIERTVEFIAYRWNNRLYYFRVRFLSTLKPILSFRTLKTIAKMIELLTRLLYCFRDVNWLSYHIPATFRVFPVIFQQFEMLFECLIMKYLLQFRKSNQKPTFKCHTFQQLTIIRSTWLFSTNTHDILCHTLWIYVSFFFF